MADMVELANSNGDASAEKTAVESKANDVKQNGDTNVNGSCEETAMDVDEAPIVTKKVVNNEIVSTENSKSDSEESESKVDDKPAVENGSVDEPEENAKEKSEEENSQNEDSAVKEDDKAEADPFAETGDKGGEVDDEKVKSEDVEDSKDKSQNENAEKKSPSEDEAMEVDGEQKLNGSNSSAEPAEGDETDGEGTPKKNKKHVFNPTPRRSSRNVNKKQSPEVEDKDIELVEEDDSKKKDDDDIQEIDVDPFADNTALNMSSSNKGPAKKEPTLVIIDTNSILSGRGPVPIATSSPGLSKPPGLTMLVQNNKNNLNKLSSNKPAVPSVPPPILLPSLTDDMFVVEAPSFIVPYVYEKPPVKPLKEFVDDLDKTIKKDKEEKEKEKQKKLEEKKKEKEDKEKSDCDAKDKEKEDDEEKKEDDEEKKEQGEKDKEAKDKEQNMETDERSDDENEETKDEEKKDDEKKNSGNYFENALGKFFMHIGVNLVQEHVQTDLLKSQKRKREREGTKVSTDTLAAITSLTKTLEFSKENNDPFRFDMLKCEYCNFKTESKLVMAHHLETPHMKNYIYRCNFCPLEVRSPHDIMYHMEAEHNVRGRLEKAPAFHQCPSCLFEDNQKGKLTRHLISCAKKYRPERNQEPPLDWEPPAKIPRVSRNRPNTMSPGNAVYHAAMSGIKSNQPSPVPGVTPRMPNMMAMGNNAAAAAMSQALMGRQRGRPIGATTAPGLLFRPTGPNAQNLVLPPGYSIQGGQIVQSKSGSGPQTPTVQQASKLVNQPSISITPLPRQGTPAPPAASPMPAHAKPGRPQPTGPGGKNTFVICEICDGYIKDLEQLRNHMQWIHKVKIHPKMIYNRPPLNCQKCQFRFFTDQGLERHLLGSHGLVTSSMQEAANKGKDGGRCPVCGRVYQWKLLNHVARDHNMSLKPAHLSYKCTVCTATFGMYRQFENHVYSAHSVAPRRPNNDRKPQSQGSSSNSSSSTDPMLKPLKINDEITIIPQPARPSNNSPSTNSNKVKITPVPSKK